MRSTPALGTDTGGSLGLGERNHRHDRSRTEVATILLSVAVVRLPLPLPPRRSVSGADTAPMLDREGGASRSLKGYREY